MGRRLLLVALAGMALTGCYPSDFNRQDPYIKQGDQKGTPADRTGGARMEAEGKGEH